MKQTLIVDCFSRTVPGVYFGQPSNVQAAQKLKSIHFLSADIHVPRHVVAEALQILYFHLEKTFFPSK